MFVGIVGPTCSGKHEIMNLLVSVYGFTPLFLRSDTTTTLSSSSIHFHAKNHHGEQGYPIDRSQEFDTISVMLDYVTLNWMNHFVTCNVSTVEGISELCKRPFFLILSVESPIMVRYRRCVARSQRHGLSVPTLEEFAEVTDAALYTIPTSPNGVTSSVLSIQSTESGQNQNLNIPAANETNGRGSTLLHSVQTSLQLPSSSSSPLLPVSTLPVLPYKLLYMSDLSILNHHSDLASLRQAVEDLDITNPELLRPSWDSYFMYLASLAARRSNCMKRRVGCVLVRDQRVIATGYNGTPKNLRNCNDGGCPRCNQATPCGEGLDRCLCMHAEENALLEAGRERVGLGSTIYCNTCPCLGCAIKIVQVGVSRVVYSESYGMDVQTTEVFREANVKLLQHSKPRHLM
ncbi:Deoxycytidine monophosphate (dCMP) deaminase [Modicella reniformis]|uniref:Deoxycytidylate deaminase n=1 Tax=Modicella reniformis TaxID=1440133 RepID=A0A9P6ILJ3_9FUNG|nr:Deoxycytidine monophosphate (dCMP) deaminase [Modicella reniformis]